MLGGFHIEVQSSQDIHGHLWPGEAALDLVRGLVHMLAEEVVRSSVAPTTVALWIRVVYYTHFVDFFAPTGVRILAVAR